MQYDNKQKSKETKVVSRGFIAVKDVRKMVESRPSLGSVEGECGTAYKCLLLSRVYSRCCDVQIQNDVALS